MQENSPHAPAETGARQKANDSLLKLMRDIEGRVAAEVDAAGLRARLAFSEQLNQMLRRLRCCVSPEEVAAWLVDSCAPQFCGRAALFELSDGHLRGIRARGFPIARIEDFEDLNAPLAEAPAVAQAAREKDTIAAIGVAGEVSTAILDVLGQVPGEKVYLFPMVIEDRTAAILYVAGDIADMAGLELLTHAAAGAAHVFAARETPVSRPLANELVAIAGVKMNAAVNRFSASRRPAGPLEQEAVAAKARWFARVEIARLRLFHREALDQGCAQRSIYTALKKEIDAARAKYRRDFLAVSPAIADYLDKELIGLAHNDANLLGPDYPGSLV